MVDIDIDSVTRMLGRGRDQEINGLHYEAVDRAAEASGLSSEELGRLAASPEIRDLVDQRREALSMNQATVDRFWQVEGDAADVDRANDAMRDSAERLERAETRLEEAAVDVTGNPDAGERLMGFVDRGRPLIEQAGSQELRGMLHLNQALEAGQEQAEARLPRGQEPSAELRAESEEHLAAAKQALEAPPAPAATKEPATSVGRDMAPAVAVDRGAPRVGPAPAASVPSPGGAPRVGGHVQGRSHEQGPSMDR